MKNLMELINMARGQTSDIKGQAEILAAFGPPPADDEFKPKIALPVTNELPSFSVKQPGVGGVLTGQDHGVAAPVFGQEGNAEPTLGQLLLGDSNATT